jgi:predicted Zn-dependent protease
MVSPKAVPTVQQALAQASQALHTGDSDAADRVLAPLLEGLGANPRLLHMAGLVRMHQQRFDQAAQLFARARAADPTEALLAFSHGTALQWGERPDDAVAAFRTAFGLKPDYAEAYYEAGTTLKRLHRLEEAEEIFRRWLRALPHDAQARLSLGGVLLDAERPQEAQTIFAAALNAPASPQVQGALHHNFA